MREADILSQLTTGVAACNSADDKASMIPMAVDRFGLDGPNGTHPCFVTVPARCSLMDAKEASDSRLLQLDVARSCGMGVISEEERVALLELLHWMLAWKSRERPNAEEVLDTAWMKRWASPAYEESRSISVGGGSFPK
ncbi:hypothetical protein QQZ08_002659 [Neonectria magnoliae]|uniref:Uncharacterized protein n=1 Tax=Neonectria magnoliae TaxID=2732573 RepID=A0ABR1IB93_9HYPO